MKAKINHSTINSMKNQPSPASTPDQPVAYDAEGRPLYHHPPELRGTTSHVKSRPEMYEGNNFHPRTRAQYANEPGVVHTTRPLEPVVPDISDALRRKHEESKRLYPYLNLSEGEFVLMRIRRHPIGLLIPVLLTGFVLTILATILLLVPDMYQNRMFDQGGADLVPAGALVGGILITMILVALVGGVAVWVYLRNQFFLTNESVIQEIQHGLFSRHEQTVSLGSVEDASFKKYGVMPHLFNYGLMRLSTEGEETTYRFNFVEDPKEQVAIVNNAVEAFKNGRPVGVEFLDK